MEEQIENCDDTKKQIKILKKEIEGVTELYLSEKEIVKISGIEKLTNLYLNNNQISDISDILNLTLNGLNLKEQQIVIEAKQKEIELPKIFVQAKIEDNIVYTENDLALENCIFTDENKTKVQINNDAIYGIVKIIGGKLDGSEIRIVRNLDRIEVETKPIKTEYVIGQNFEKEGMIVKATYNDESTKEIENYEIADGENLAKGKEGVTIRYKEKEYINVNNEINTVSLLINKIKNENSSNVTVEVYDETGNKLKSTKKIITNMKVVITDGTKTEEYKTVRKGYVNNDEEISPADIMKLLMHLAEVETKKKDYKKILVEANLLATDIDENGIINAFDIIQFMKLLNNVK